MTSVIGRGLAAGAVGTALLNAATYVDILLTGREANRTPGRTVRAMARTAGFDPPDEDSRLEAYGELGGLAAGLGVGLCASFVRRLGVHLPAPVGAAATGLAAMAVTDAATGAAGVSDPSTWSRAAWVRDVVPHLAYGAGVRWTMDQMTPPEGEHAIGGEVTTGLLVRSVLVGVSAGLRSSMGALTAAVVSGRRAPTVVAGGMVVGELAVDKLPTAPSRLEAGPLGGRLAAGAVGGGALGAQASVPTLLPALAGLAGAGVGAVAGAAWREAAAERGWTWPAALVEDGVALGLVAAVVRRH